ncbi:unnamed protein product [Peronospora belbahrii]|uniref:Uncharacterized protein n=1 Tax=Peronospora belbahrii TaxID=622444 RepID=A0ABN8D7G4_9STRA|nr:unnamed protein product [Peronospora belbahrii]
MEEDSWNQKWDFLLPWCQRISWRLQYVKGMIQDAPGQHFEGIKVHLPSFGSWNEEHNKLKTSIQYVRETLSLLAAVAHVDNTMWKKLLLQCTDFDVDNEEAGYEGIFMPRFQLAVDDNGPDNDYHLLTGIMEFCGTVQYTSQSAEYKEALARIFAMNDTKSSSMSMEIEIPITVQLGPWMAYSSNDMLTYLRKLQNTVRMIRTQWQQYRNWEQFSLSTVFALESIIVDLRDFSICTGLAELVESLACDGIRVSGLALRQDEFESELTSNGNIEKAHITVGKLMFGLFGGAKPMEWEDCGVEATSITGPLAAEYGYANQLASKSVHFDCEAMENWVFERMCSAVAVNQTTEHLSLGLELDGGENNDQDGYRAHSCWRWQWIIFACFSEKARLHSRLKSLALHNAVITLEAVKSMAVVLAGEGPEEYLLGYSCCTSEELVDTCIQAGSPIELLSVRMDDEDAFSTGRSFTLDREITGVRRMTKLDQNDCATVLVPGFGRCQVQRKNLVYRKLTLPSNSLAGTTSLAIKFSEDPDPDILQGLLLLVGVSLTHLALKFESFNTSELEGIVASCPNLVELAVSTDTIEIRFCLRGNKYRDMALHDKSCLCFSNVEGIAEALCDYEYPLTKCVRRLRVRIPDDPFDKCCGVLLRMLEMNYTLECVDVIAPCSHMKHYDTFKAHHLEPLSLKKSALSMDCKVAFLSVIGAKNGELVNKKRRKDPSLLPMLDQNVLRSIFEYATPHMSRQVYFRQYNLFKTGHAYTPI